MCVYCNECQCHVSCRLLFTICPMSNLRHDHFTYYLHFTPSVVSLSPHVAMSDLKNSYVAVLILVI